MLVPHVRDSEIHFLARARNQIGSLFARSIIRNDNLEIPVALAGVTVENALEITGPIVCGNDDRDCGHAVAIDCSAASASTIASNRARMSSFVVRKPRVHILSENFPSSLVD